jgi:hypothetical protein
MTTDYGTLYIHTQGLDTQCLLDAALQLPDGSYNRWPQYVGAQKLSFMQQLEIKLVCTFKNNFSNTINIFKTEL